MAQLSDALTLRSGNRLPNRFMLAPLTNLQSHADGINAEGSLSGVQLHHAGMRTMADVVGHAPLCPSDNEETGARAMTHDEVQATVQDFVAAAVRAQQVDNKGVEVTGSHEQSDKQF